MEGHGSTRGVTSADNALHRATLRLYLILEVCIFLQNRIGAKLQSKKRGEGESLAVIANITNYNLQRDTLSTIY